MTSLQTPRRARRAAVAASALSALLLATSACGSDDSTSGGVSAADAPSVSKDDAIAKMVPADIAEAGTLTVASEIYPPAVIQPAGGGEPTGWDVETVKAVAAILGLKADIKIVPFDGIVPGLQAGRYQAAAGEIFITDERTDVVTFVKTHLTTDSLLVKADSDVSGETEADLCGLTLSVQLGSVEAQLANDIAEKCDSDGGDAVEVKTFQEQAAVNLAVNEGRADAAIGSTSQVAYVVDQSGNTFKTVELPWGPSTPTGIALARNDDTPELAKAIEAAVDQMIEDGTLQKILDTYNGGLGMIDESAIVPASGS